MRHRWALSLLLLGLLPMVAAAQSSLLECTVEPHSERLLAQSIGDVPTSFKPDPKRYVDTFTKTDILIDVRERFESDQLSQGRIRKGLQVPLYSLRAKPYLKNKSLILVGNGLDYYALEKEIDKLEQSGFRSVRILRFGILALTGLPEFFQAPADDMSLRQLGAQDVVAASLGRRDDFLFINLQSDQDVYTHLDLSAITLPFVNEKAFYQQLYTLAQQQFEQNDTVHIVLVHDDPAVYQTISRSKEMFSMLGLLFVDGGNSALVDLHQQVAKTAVLSTKVKRHCAG